MAISALFKAFPGRPMAPVIEFLPDTVFYTICPVDPLPKEGVVYFSIDNKLTYNAFYLDFGPHNLGATFQFCNVMNIMVATIKATGNPTKPRRQIYFYSSPDPHMRANAVCLLTCWGVLFQGMTPAQAFAPFSFMSFPSFHDASPTTCDFQLTILDCLHGLARALHYHYIEPKTFDLTEFHHYEQVDNGDLTWISPKLLAFAGPQNEHVVSSEGYVALTPEHYIPYFKKKGVTLVVRLNEPLYDASRFTKAGIAHVDLFYPDGSNPPTSVLLQFLELCERTRGSVAIHCKAGLGRTGTCIAAYMMKHHRFSAEEAIGWLRLCRPGSVIGPQQQYLESVQTWLWQLGDARTREKYGRMGAYAPASPESPPRTPGRGRLLTTRTINIYGGRKSVDLSANVGVGVTATDLAHIAATHEEKRAQKIASQGDYLLRRKQENQSQPDVR